MNRITHAIKLCMLTSSLAALPYVNAAENNSSITTTKARAFIETADIEQKDLVDTTNLAWYIKDRFTTLDTENHLANLLKKGEQLDIKLAYQAIEFNDLQLNNDLTRRLNNIISSAHLYPSHPHPNDERKVTILKNSIAEISKKYAENTACIKKQSEEKVCLNTQQITKEMAENTDESELKELWRKWHNNLTPLKPLFQQQVQYNNEGAKRFGFSDRADMQLSQFEMPTDKLIIELDKVWLEIAPLYKSLHSLIRTKLIQKYGEEVVKPNQAIPAHLLSKINVNDLSNVFELIKPEDAVTDRGYNIAEKLEQKQELDVPTMLHGIENYMASMGFAPFKESLYQFSQFTKPEHHKAACDPTAWWLPQNNEARVGGCWDVNAETFMRFNTTSLLTPTYFRAAHSSQPGHYANWPVATTSAVFRVFQYALSLIHI